MKNKQKVSCICTTYRRAYCVSRILAQFNAQTYDNKELIIFNTDEEYPFVMETPQDNVIIVNNGIDYQSGLPYTNRGFICRDAITHATGDIFSLWDDDDLFFPWFIEQGVDGLEQLGTDAWKPEQSFFATGDRVELTMNTLEASVIVKMPRIRQIGFRSDITGYEGLSWYTQLRDERQLDEHNKNYVPSYCFNWSDPHEIAGHKQSGDINNPNNFDNHKEQSKDVANLPLEAISNEELYNTYRKYFEWLKSNLSQVNEEYYNRYAIHHIN